MTDQTGDALGSEFKELAATTGDTPVAPAHGIAAIALSMALKYHDMSMVTDGTLYQQYKLEGRNIREIGLADVFETAIKIENHLLGASARIASVLVDALSVAVEAEGPDEARDGCGATAGSERTHD